MRVWAGKQESVILGPEARESIGVEVVPARAMDSRVSRENDAGGFMPGRSAR